jgi:hypothetical protein
MTAMQVQAGSRKRVGRQVAVVVGGLLLGALLTRLLRWALPQSAAREFFVTTVAASVGPVSVDLLVIALTLGPLVLRVNILSAVGILLVAWFARSLL